MNTNNDMVLSVEHVDLGYGSLQVIFDVSLQVKRGELIGLVGGNGSGKSTMLRAVSGMIQPWKGNIFFQGESIAGLEPHQLASRKLAHVPMGRQLFTNLSVKENILLGSYLPSVRAFRKENYAKVMDKI